MRQWLSVWLPSTIKRREMKTLNTAFRLLVRLGSDGFCTFVKRPDNLLETATAAKMQACLRTGSRIGSDSPTCLELQISCLLIRARY